MSFGYYGYPKYKLDNPFWGVYFMIGNKLNISTLISLQYEAKDLSGSTSDDFGTCDVTQKLDQMEMQITKKNCQKSKNTNQQRDNYTENFLDNGNVSGNNEIELRNIYIHHIEIVVRIRLQ